MGATLVPFPDDCKPYPRQRKQTGYRGPVAATHDAAGEAPAEPIPISGSCPTCGALNSQPGRSDPREASARVIPALGREERQGSSLPPLKTGLDAIDMLNMLNIGVVVTNESRRVLFANETAEHILAAQDGLEVVKGVLGTQHRCCSPSLAEALQFASQPGNRPVKNAVLAVKRRSGKRRLTLLLRRIRSGSSLTNPNVPAFLFFILDPNLPVQSTEAELSQLYGLTSSEARLANLLMEGKTLEDCCQQLKIRISTGRMHLGNLFAKTGVQRQGQLISLLLKSFGLVRMGWNLESDT